MADLKISQFADGGIVQDTDEIAAVRAGVNTKVVVGSMATEDAADYTPTSGLGDAAFLDVGADIGELLLIQNVGGNPGLPALDGSQLTNLPIPGGGSVESVNGITPDSTGDVDLANGFTGSIGSTGDRVTKLWAINAEVTNPVTINGTGQTVNTDPTGVTGADKITNIMSLTTAEYAAIVAPNASTLYIITDA